MSQHDFNITQADADAGVDYRAAVNAALQALGSLSSGATAPTTTYAYQLWADTTTGLLKQRNATNTAWAILFPLPGASNVTANITVSSSPYNLSVNTRFLRVDASGGDITINLPWTGSYYPYEELVIKRTDSSLNRVTLIPDSSGQGGIFDSIETGGDTLLAGNIKRYWPVAFRWYISGQYLG